MAFPLVDGTTGETTDVHAGLVAKRVRCAATTAVTKATGVENGDTIDGVVLATGDRVALLAQAAGAENGIWVVAASGAPTRSLDFDESAEVLPGTLIVVSEGTANKDSIWQLTTNEAITLGTTALVFFPIHMQGTGSPEGAVTAPIGATYRRTDGGASTTFYIKESGTGNTGWAAPSTGSSGLTKLFKGSSNSDQNGIGTSATTLTGSSSGSISVPADGVLLLATCVFQKKTGAGYGLFQFYDSTAGAVLSDFSGGLASQSINGYDVVTMAHWHDPATGARTYELRATAEVNTIDVPRWSFTILG